MCGCFIRKGQPSYRVPWGQGWGEELEGELQLRSYRRTAWMARPIPRKSWATSSLSEEAQTRKMILKRG